MGSRCWVGQAGLALAALTAITACKKNATSGGATGPNGVATADAADADRLWALTPSGTFAGVVLTKQGATAAWAAVQTLLAHSKAWPSAGAQIEAGYRDVMQAFTGNPNGKLADAGLGLGAAALFMGREQMVLVLPVIDRTKFVAAVHGTPAADPQSGVDTIDSMQCAPRKGFYVCASSVALLDQLGTESWVGRVAAVGARGDLELLADFDKAPPNPFLTKGAGAAVVQMGAGQVVVRGLLPRGPEPMQFDRKIQLDTAGAAGFLLADLMPLLKASPEGNADQIAALGVDGRITAVLPAGSMNLDGRLWLTDEKFAKMAVSKCDETSPIEDVTFTATNGICTVASTLLGASSAAWVEAKQLRLARTQGPVVKGIDVPRSALGNELADGSWHVAMWGRGNAFVVMSALLRTLPTGPLPPAQAALALRIVALISELGVGIEARSNDTRFIAGVRTVFSNPAALVAAYNQAQAGIERGEFDGAALATIAQKYPNSDFANDVKAGPIGLLAPVSVIGVLTAVAIPAYFEYMNAGRPIESELHLDRLRKVNAAKFNTDGAFVAGTTTLVPALSCCEINFQNKKKCAGAEPEWQDPTWQALGMALDESHYFQYQYTGTATSFKAIAVGNLDCDDTTVTYTMEGHVVDGKPTYTLTRPQNMD